MSSDEEWTDDAGRAWTRDSFLSKMEYEGGFDSMIGWGGPSVFPPSLKEAARQVEAAMELFEQYYVEPPMSPHSDPIPD